VVVGVPATVEGPVVVGVPVAAGVPAAASGSCRYSFVWQFLLDHPHRYFTTSQIMSQAWADPALFPEEVRNYVRRVRKILADLAIPVDLVNKPGRGYSLVFRPN
jgi:hypothetical protein